jgi:tetratricopeptide (TPR) repeat protein
MQQPFVPPRSGQILGFLRRLLSFPMTKRLKSSTARDCFAGKVTTQRTRLRLMADIVRASERSDWLGDGRTLFSGIRWRAAAPGCPPWSPAHLLELWAQAYDRLVDDVVEQARPAALGVDATLAFAHLAVIEVALRSAALRVFYDLPPPEALPRGEHSGQLLQELRKEAKVSRALLASRARVRRQTVDGWCKGTPIDESKLALVVQALTGSGQRGVQALARRLRWHYARWSVQGMLARVVGASAAAELIASWARLTGHMMAGFAWMWEPAQRRLQAPGLMAGGRLDSTAVFLRLYAAEAENGSAWTKALALDDTEYVLEQIDLSRRMGDADSSRPNLAPAVREILTVLPPSAWAFTATFGKAQQASAAVTLHVEAHAALYSARARQARLVKDYETALRYGQLAIDLEPASAALHYEVGVVLGDLEMLDESSQHLIRSIQCEPTREASWIALAGIEQQRGKVTRSFRILQRGLGICGPSASLLYQLGWACCLCGDLPSADAFLRRALAAAPEAGSTLELAAIVAESSGGNRRRSSRLAKEAAHRGRMRALANRRLPVACRA